MTARPPLSSCPRRKLLSPVSSLLPKLYVRPAFSVRRLNDLTLLFIAYADIGVDPIDFPSAPSLAIPLAIENAGLTLDEISLFEVNEAFSVVVRIVEKVLGIDPAKINVNGYVISGYYHLELADSWMSQRCCRSRPRHRKLWFPYRRLIDTCAEVWSIRCGRYLQRSTSIAIRPDT